MVAPGPLMNLAVVYAWSNELDLAFETLGAPDENAMWNLLRPIET
jgi:hypothetical protein